jgi:hypothetical protein
MNQPLERRGEGRGDGKGHPLYTKYMLYYLYKGLFYLSGSNIVDFAYSDKVKALQTQVSDFSER